MVFGGFWSLTVFGFRAFVNLFIIYDDYDFFLWRCLVSDVFLFLVGFRLWRLLVSDGFWFLDSGGFGFWWVLVPGGFWFLAVFGFWSLAVFGFWWFLVSGGFWFLAVFGFWSLAVFSQSLDFGLGCSIGGAKWGRCVGGFVSVFSCRCAHIC